MAELFERLSRAQHLSVRLLAVAILAPTTGQGVSSRVD